MRRISATQKKINILTALGVAAFLLVWGFVYQPSRKVIKELNGELDRIKAQIRQIEGKDMASGEGNKGFRRIEARSRWVNSKFPEKEEKALRMLSELAKESGIEVFSIRSQPKATFLDEDAQGVEIGGRVCRKLLVSIEVKAMYNDLVGYLDKLKESLPAYVTIQNLRIRKEALGGRVLNITLDINLYLLTS